MKRLLLLALLLTLGIAHPAAAQGDAILGHWLTEGGKATVEITKDGDTFKGQILEIGEPTYPADDPMAGQKRVDRNNPDKSLRDRPIVGLVILTGLKAAGGKAYESGRIYDAESGKTYKAKAEINDEGNLDMRGYVGFSLIGRTTTWTRVETAEAEDTMEGQGANG